MTQDISHWLTEIRTLQRQLADVRKERDQAFASAANWRRLYETEARQRRHEVENWRSQRHQDQSQPPQSQPSQLAAHPPSEAAPMQAQLTAALERCQELMGRLEAERQAHAHTRQTLTTALGEAFDTLKSKQIAHSHDLSANAAQSKGEAP